MNELRMYVEHLFRGHVLTDETIELKEEIYGNLVARYEDYRAQGMSEADALAKTKDSITSVSDLMGEDAEKADAAPAPDAAPTTVLPSAAAGSAAGVETTSPAPAAGSEPFSPAAPAEAPRKKLWPIVVGAVAGVLVIVVIAVFAMNLIAGPDSSPETTQSVVTAETDSSKATDTSASGNAGKSTSNDQTDASKSTDAAQEGTASSKSENSKDAASTTTQTPVPQRPYSEIGRQIYDLTVNDVKQYAQAGILGNATNTASLFNALPGNLLGVSVDSVDAGSKTIKVSYSYQEDTVDDDELDEALVYNAAVAMCATDAPDTVQYTVCDELKEYDHDHSRGWDHDVYVVTRQDLEDVLGVKLNADCLASQDAFENSIRNQALIEDLSDYLLDRAERS